MQGGIIDKDMPIDASNVMIICPEVRTDQDRCPVRRPGQEAANLPQM